MKMYCVVGQERRGQKHSTEAGKRVSWFEDEQRDKKRMLVVVVEVVVGCLLAGIDGK